MTSSPIHYEDNQRATSRSDIFQMWSDKSGPWEECTLDAIKKFTGTDLSAFAVSIRERPEGSNSAQVRYRIFDTLDHAEAHAYATIGQARTRDSPISHSMQLIIIPTGKSDFYNRCVNGLNVIRDDWDIDVMGGICSFTKHRRKIKDVSANANPFWDEKTPKRERNCPLGFAYSIVSRVVLQDSVMAFYDATDVGIGVLNCRPRRLPYILHEALRLESVFCTPGVISHPLAIPLLLMNGMVRYYAFETQSTAAIDRVQQEVGFYFYDAGL